MGQSTSSSPTIRLSKPEISELFFKLCVKQFNELELYSFKTKFGLSDLDQNQFISKDELTQFLGLPDSVPESVVSLLYRSIRILGNFPYFTDFSKKDGLNTTDALVALVLYSDRYGRILSKNYDILKAFFISISLTESESAPIDDVEVPTGEKLSWLNIPVVDSFDNIDVDQLRVSAIDLLDLLTFLLVISRLHGSAPIYSRLESFADAFNTKWGDYHKHALNLVKTVDSSVTPANIHSVEISYDQFNRSIKESMPNLLKPLDGLLDHLLYLNSEMPTDVSKPMATHSKLIDEPFLAQLSTFLPRELVYSKMIKLYVGSDSGFSMRSFESKCFKWNAPSILLVSGKRIKQNTTNKRYQAFSEQYPRYKGDLLDWQKNQSSVDKITYGVYVNVPWRFSNKDCFGDSRTLIFQISPKQNLFHASAVGKNYVYFNTLGGGIGFGNDQPKIKNNTKKFEPGNVSLTIEPSLEFAVFRHTGIGGTFLRGTSGEDEVYEDRIAISDMEVWGCGNEKELAEQAKRWEWEEREAQARQRVNVKNLGEDRALLEMAGLVGQHQSGGSM